MQTIVPDSLTRFPYLNNPALGDMAFRQAHATVATRQIISLMNLNPEDFVAPDAALALCRAANTEMQQLVGANPQELLATVAAVPMNNLPGALNILTTDVAPNPHVLGIQLFTRALGKSIAAPVFDPLFAKAAALDVPIWLHPVFDARKPDNNLLFSWEYELSQAMYQLVQAGVFTRYPSLKIIVHHAGAMVSFFAGRIQAILPPEQARAFKNFYVDTAILGNPDALRLAVAYFGSDHVLFGTDMPLGRQPVGASEQILVAIDQAGLTAAQVAQIKYRNAQHLLRLG